jgi:hypothetical protein
MTDLSSNQKGNSTITKKHLNQLELFEKAFSHYFKWLKRLNCTIIMLKAYLR